MRVEMTYTQHHPAAEGNIAIADNVHQVATSHADYTIQIVDSPESFDIIVTDPDGKSEAVWSAAKEEQA